MRRLSRCATPSGGIALPSPLLELAPSRHRRRFKRCQWNSTRARIAYAKRSIDRHSSTLELYGASVVISFGLVGRRSFTEFVSRTGWIASLSPEFEVAGSSFAGRSFNVGGFSPRRASISVRSRDRDVSCVDFVSIIHPDYRPEPIRERTLIKLARSRRRRRDDKKGRGKCGIWRTIAARHSRLFLERTDPPSDTRVSFERDFGDLLAIISIVDNRF